MACLYAPNGKSSTLFKEAKELYGEEEAKRIWGTVRTPTFKDSFGDWQSLANVMVGVKRGSLEHYKILNAFSTVSPFVDANFEPKLFFSSSSLDTEVLNKVDGIIHQDTVRNAESISSTYSNFNRELSSNGKADAQFYSLYGLESLPILNDFTDTFESFLTKKDLLKDDKIDFSNLKDKDKQAFIEEFVVDQLTQLSLYDSTQEGDSYKNLLKSIYFNSKMPSEGLTVDNIEAQLNARRNEMGLPDKAFTPTIINKIPESRLRYSSELISEEEFDKITAPTLSKLATLANKKNEEVNNEIEKFSKKYNRIPNASDMSMFPALRFSLEAAKEVRDKLDNYLLSKQLPIDTLSDNLVLDTKKTIAAVKKVVVLKRIETKEQKELKETLESMDIPNKDTLLTFVDSNLPAYLDTVKKVINNPALAVTVKGISFGLNSTPTNSNKGVFVATKSIKIVRGALTTEKTLKAKQEGYRGISNGKDLQMFSLFGLLDTSGNQVRQNQNSLSPSKAIGILSKISNKLGVESYVDYAITPDSAFTFGPFLLNPNTKDGILYTEVSKVDDTLNTGYVHADTKETIGEKVKVNLPSLFRVEDNPTIVREIVEEIDSKKAFKDLYEDPLTRALILDKIKEKGFEGALIGTQVTVFNKDHLLTHKIAFRPTDFTLSLSASEFILGVSGILSRSSLTKTMVDTHGDKAMVANYKTIFNKATLSNKDYEVLALKHLVTLDSLAKPFKGFLEGALTAATTELNLSTTPNFFELSNELGLNEETGVPTNLKFSSSIDEIGKIEEIARDFTKKVKFEALPTAITNPFTGIVEKSHTYTLVGTSIVVQDSITSIIGELPNMDFDEVAVFSKMIHSNTTKEGTPYTYPFRKTAADGTVYVDEAEIVRFIASVLAKDIDSYLGDMAEEYHSLASDPKAEKPTLSIIFEHFTALKRKWALSGLAGTGLHSIAQAVFTDRQEDLDKLHDIRDIKEYLENQLEVDYTSLAKSHNPQDPIEVAKLLYLKSLIEYKKNLMSIKADIQKRGGRVLTEFIVHSDKVKTKDGTTTRFTAGQVDMLVIYEDADHVDKDYRGKFEIYDFKSMSKKVSPDAPFIGFTAKNQVKYSAQILLYARILEEELGMDFKDGFIIPIHIPVVTLDETFNPTPMDSYIQGSFDIINTIQYEADGTSRKDAQGRDVRLPLLNIKALGGRYIAGRMHVNALLPSTRYKETEVEEESEIIAEPDTFTPERRVEIADKASTLIDDFKILLGKRMQKAKQLRTTNKELAAKKEAAVLKIQTDLLELEGVEKIIKIIHSSFEELVGKDGLLVSFETTMAKFNNGDITVNKALQLIDDIRIDTKNYDILDAILSQLLDTTAEERAAIEGSDIYKKLTKAITTKNRILNDRYIPEMTKLLSKRLIPFVAVNGNMIAQDTIDSVTILLDNDIKSAEKALDKAKKGGSKTAIHKAEVNLAAANQKKIDSIATLQDSLIITEESLVRSLIQLPKDISFIQRHFVSATASSDHLLSVFANMVKNDLSLADLALKEIGMEVQDWAEKLDLGVFGKGVGNIWFTQGDNPATFFAPILETVKEWVRSSETGEIALEETINLISIFGTGPHTIIGKDGKPEVVQMTYKNIIKDYRFRLNELLRESKMADYRALNDEFQKWADDNLEREFTDEFYKMHEPFLRDEIGRKAKALRDVITAEIQTIKDTARLPTEDYPEGRGDLSYTEEETDLIREAEIRLKRLASNYNEDSTRKTAEEIAIAERIKEFNTLFIERHEFEVSEDIFERKRQQALILFANNPSKYKLWLENNTELVIDEKITDKVFIYRKTNNLFKWAVRNNKDVFSEIVSLLGDNLPSKELGEAIDAIIEKLTAAGEIDEDTFKQGNDEISDLLKPYRQGLKIDALSVPDAIAKELIQMETALEEQYVADKLSPGEYKSDKEKWDTFFLISKELNGRVSALVEYIPSNEYYEMLEKARVLADSLGIDVKSTSWYQLNHVMKRGQYVPIRIWTQMVPASRIVKPSEQYHLDKEATLNELMEKEPGRTPEFYKDLLKKTEWWKNTHIDDSVSTDLEHGLIKEDSGYLTIDTKKTDSVTLVPNFRYRRPKVKKEYKRDDASIYDESGYLNPMLYKRGTKTPLWLNPAYTQLQRNKPYAEFHKQMLNLYLTHQEMVPEQDRLGTRLPYVHKSSKERIGEGGLLALGKDTWDTYVGTDKAREYAEGMTDADLQGAGESLSQEDAKKKVSGGIAVRNYSIDEKRIPVRYTQHVDISKVSRDVVSSILTFVAEARRYKALNGVLSETRALSALLAHREGPEGKGTVDRTTGGSKKEDSLAKSLGLTRLIRKDGESLASALTRNFIEMHIFGEQNKPVEIKVPVTRLTPSGKLRVDKISDSLMGLASYSQIGGLTTGGIVKGIANTINANFQIFFEGAAGEFFTLGDLRKAKKIVYWGGEGFGSTFADMSRDFGRIAGKTMTSQLFEVYDPMQGTFEDEFGNKVTGSRIAQMLSTSLWFLNIYTGEVEAAMTTMFALMSGYKIDEKGNVYSIDDFLALKQKEKGSKLTYKERIAFEKEHNKMKKSLVHAFEKDAKGRLVVKAGINWKFDSPASQAFKRRLHGISKELQGSYAKRDKTSIQQTFGGRLLIMYRKYLVPALRRRFGSMSRNEEIGTVREGMYITLYRHMMSDWKSMGSKLFNSLFHKTDKGLSRQEEANFKRAFMELTTIMLLWGATMLLSRKLNDDDDETEPNTAEYFLLYQTVRLRKELSALAPTPTVLQDNWKILNSPSAMEGFVNRVIKLVDQVLSDASGVYKRDSGVAEKGDSKVYWKFRKLLGSLGLPGIWEHTNIEEMFENINRKSL